MGFVIAVVLALALVVVIGFAALYIGALVVFALVGFLCLLAFGLLYAVLGEQNISFALVLSVPIGIGAAIMLSSKNRK